MRKVKASQSQFSCSVQDQHTSFICNRIYDTNRLGRSQALAKAQKYIVEQKEELSLLKSIIFDDTLETYNKLKMKLLEICKQIHSLIKNNPRK